MSEHTPMIKQYLEIKKDFPDMLLLYRLGDFYELFFEDAIKASKLLDLTLTHRGKSGNQVVHMAGIPYHTLDNYLIRLIKHKESVAICEQVGEITNKGPIERKVTRIITPGTITDELLLEAKKDNLILTIYKINNNFYLAWINLSLGLCSALCVDNKEQVKAAITRLNPAEILSTYALSKEEFLQNAKIRPDWEFSLEHTRDIISKQFMQQNYDDGITQTVGCLLNYLYHTQKQALPHIKTINFEQDEEFLYIDSATQEHLEIFTNRNGSNENTLLAAIDNTVSPMGSRLLKRWLARPILNHQILQERQETIAQIITKNNNNFVDLIKQIADLERITSRIALKSAKPHDLTRLRDSLKIIPLIKSELQKFNSIWMQNTYTKLPLLTKLLDFLTKAIQESPANNIKDGNVIANNFDEELDTLRKLTNNACDYLLQLEQEEKINSKIPSLKIGFNKIHGYYFELSGQNIAKAPAYFQRKQTLKNTERFITPKLKQFEDKILSAQAKMLMREKFLYEDVLEQLQPQIDELLLVADLISQIDVLQNLAQIAINFNWSCPTFSTERVLNIIEGKHPIISIKNTENFIANDLKLNTDKFALLITGPNMGGKSTYMRQNALIIILAHIGSYIPAKSAHIGAIDKIFTRIGANDDITIGKSTFMVEMSETANILNNATDKSLVLIDEIGRGTSTQDGSAIAYACFAYFIEHIKSYTLFATHYAQLISMENIYPQIQNVHVKAICGNDKITFLYKIEPGHSNKSYGIEVAALAGIPPKILSIAKDFIKDLPLDCVSSS